MNSLENVKVGDKLLVRSQFGESIQSVTRITTTLVVTGHSRFKKSSGEKIRQVGTSWSWAAPATTEDIERVRRNAWRKQLISSCNTIDFEALSNSQMERIIEIANEDNNENNRTESLRHCRPGNDGACSST